MTKFQKIQKLSSIIPVFSTVFVAFVTMFELKKQKASMKRWLCFILAFFGFGILAYLLNAVIMTGEHPILNLIASALILACANHVMVELQIQRVKNTETVPKKKIDTEMLIICIASGVAFVIVMILLFTPSVQFDDVNGEGDTSLAILETSEIIRDDNNYSALGSSTSYRGEKTNVRGTMKDYDYGEVSYRCKKLSGIMTLQVTKAECDSVTLEIDSTLEKGNLQIAVIVDGQLYELLEANKAKTVVLTDVAQKTICVKAAAESAQAKISVKRSFTK